MGSSPTAKLAWAIDLGDAENDEDAFEWTDIDEDAFESEIIPALFGFTEEPPEYPGTRGDAGWRPWWEANRKPYNERKEAAIPLAFESHGYEYAGTALVLKRSLHRVEWGAEPIDPAKIAPPTDAELAAFATVAERLGVSDRPVSLLLMSTYG